MADVRLDAVSKRFGATEAVTDLSLAIADGEFVVLLGPTGAGKTTTLRLVAGLERPDAGAVSIGGVDMTAAPPAARDVTFVFQQYSLYPHLTVYDNLAFPRRSPTRQMDARTIDAKVRAVAGLLRIDTKLENKATQLSGGQMQRVALGRALVREPSVYLMDEPLSSLDAKLRSELRLELKRVQAELGATILYVTHDQIEAMTMATRIGVMEAGRLVQIGTPREIYERPASTYVATRLGQPAINILPADLFPGAPRPSAARTVGIRTEHLLLGPARAEAPAGRVRRIEHLGDRSHLHVDLAGHALVLLADPEAGFGVGDEVSVTLERPLWFDASGIRIGG